MSNQIRPAYLTQVLALNLTCVSIYLSIYIVLPPFLCLDIIVTALTFCYVCILFVCHDLGICETFEKRLRDANPSLNNITYDISDLYKYIDALTDMSALV